MNIRKIALIGSAAIAAGFLLIQFIPYGRAHDNPPVVAEPEWADPQTRELARRACYDCHSHETVWPWYSRIAPVSWLVQRDVAEGRTHLNFSDWNQSHEGHGHAGHEPEEMEEAIRSGDMPPASYLLKHPAARLTDAERAALIEGLAATAAHSPAGDDHDDGQQTEEHEDTHEEEHDD